MTSEEIEAKVKELICQQLEVSPEQVRDVSAYVVNVLTKAR